MQIWTLPKLTLVFSTTALSTLQNVCIDSYEGPAPSASPDRKPSDTDVESILIAPLGESYHKPHLFVSSRTFVHTSRENFLILKLNFTLGMVTFWPTCGI